MAWWKWLLSIPKSRSPVPDRNGSFAHIQQNDPDLFFLCQTFESTNYIPQRSIELPRGKKIFMPILNWLSVKDGNQTDQEMIALANERIGQVGKLEICINGRQIIDDFENYRIRSPFFELALCDDNILDAEPKNTRLLSDGYWVMLEPVSREIKLTSLGACSSGAIGLLLSIISR